MTVKISPKNRIIDEAELDRISRILVKESLPEKYTDSDGAWGEELAKRIHAVIDMFDDGAEVVTQAKIADGMTRMFEKMMYKDMEYGTQLRNERADAIRADVGIEITGNRIEDIDRALDQKRISYTGVKHAYKICRYNVRPSVLGKNNLNWGQYKGAHEMSRVRRIQKRNSLTMDTAMNSRETFYEHARDTGLIDRGDDRSFSTNNS
jgi:hypothetical protein